MADYNGIMTYCEIAEGTLPSISREVLGFGRKLADDLGQELCTVLVGSDVGGLAQEAIALGADKVYVVDDPLLKEYQTDAYVAVMEKVVKQVMPHILILGQTSVGRDLAPMLAFRLDTTAPLDCVGLAIDSDTKLLLRTKPVYGGNGLATFTCESYPQIATIRDKVMPSPAPVTKQGEVITMDAGLPPSRLRSWPRTGATSSGRARSRSRSAARPTASSRASRSSAASARPSASLRRILLSSLQGAAITHIAIEGALHEFTSLPGVVEDVTDIILNLKETLFKVELDKTYTVRLDKQGEGVITAGDITLVDGVTCLNPSHKLCTLSKDGKLAMELTITTGRGYQPAERHSSELPVGTIAIDALFLPIRKVNFTVTFGSLFTQ